MKIARQHVRFVGMALMVGLTAVSGCTSFEREPREGDMLFRRDPGSGECMPIVRGSNDYLATESWGSCANPCAGLGEEACSADPRCQPVMETGGFGQPGFGSGSGFGFVDAGPPQQFFPDGGIPRDGGSFPVRDAGPPLPLPPTGVYQGCSPVARAFECDQLDPGRCSSDRRCELVVAPCSCETQFQQQPGNDPGAPPMLSCNLTSCLSPGEAPRCQARACQLLPQDSCFSRSDCQWDGARCGTAAVQPCSGLDEHGCLSRRDCRPSGVNSYCPPYMSCDEETSVNGFFTGCQNDPRPRSCRGDGDCAPGFQCQDALDCPPGEACAPSCVPAAGCSALDEARCSAQAGCVPRFQAVCVPPPGAPVNSTPQPGSPYDPGAPPPPVPCTPAQAFIGCQELAGSLVPERSLVVLDPAVLDQPRYGFLNVMTQFAGGQDPRPMFSRMLASMSSTTTINGQQVAGRPNLLQFTGSAPLDQLRFRPVAIMNRLDLVSAGNCGEARLVFASDLGAFDPTRRMTLIMEFGVPDDGQGCRTWGRQWVALSNLPTGSPEFATKLGLLTDQLFQPARLNQLRTNELMMGQPGRSDWELREFELASNELQPSTVANSPVMSPELLAWLRANQVAVALGTASVPAQFLGGSSLAVPERRLTLPTDLFELERPLNTNTCAGCHRSETGTDFVHLTERRFANGRSVMSNFLRGELGKRARVLQQLLGDSAPANVLRTRPRPPTVH